MRRAIKTSVENKRKTLTFYTAMLCYNACHTIPAITYHTISAFNLSNRFAV